MSLLLILVSSGAPANQEATPPSATITALADAPASSAAAVSVSPASATTATTADAPAATAGAVSASPASADTATAATAPGSAAGAVTAAPASGSVVASADNPGATSVQTAEPPSAVAGTSADAPVASAGTVSVAVSAAALSVTASEPSSAAGAATVAPASATATTGAEAPTPTAGATTVTPAAASSQATADAPTAVPGAVTSTADSAAVLSWAGYPYAGGSEVAAPAAAPAPAATAASVSTGGGGGTLGAGWGGKASITKARSSSGLTGAEAAEGRALLAAHWLRLAAERERPRYQGRRMPRRPLRRASGPTPTPIPRGVAAKLEALTAQAPPIQTRVGLGGYLGAVSDDVAGNCVTPSTHTASAVMRGEPGSLVAFTLATLGRALLLAPALALAGVRGPKLVKASLAGAGAISLYILIYLRSRGCGTEASP